MSGSDTAGASAPAYGVSEMTADRADLMAEIERMEREGWTDSTRLERYRACADELAVLILAERRGKNDEPCMCHTPFTCVASVHDD